jgi:hypothetical protein
MHPGESRKGGSAVFLSRIQSIYHLLQNVLSGLEALIEVAYLFSISREPVS